jgi:3-hydroxymyristoyl/3-hydroxydecanoyl-(acyl carrier protein) dehydratase
LKIISRNGEYITGHRKAEFYMDGCLIIFKLIESANVKFLKYFGIGGVFKYVIMSYTGRIFCNSTR